MLDRVAPMTLIDNIFAAGHESYMPQGRCRVAPGGSGMPQWLDDGGGPDPVPGNTYFYFHDVLEQDPHSSAPWTVTGVNAATFGVRK
jgi:hypothetical protein